MILQVNTVHTSMGDPTSYHCPYKYGWSYKLPLPIQVWVILQVNTAHTSMGDPTSYHRPYKYGWSYKLTLSVTPWLILKVEEQLFFSMLKLPVLSIKFQKPKRFQTGSGMFIGKTCSFPSDRRQANWLNQPWRSFSWHSSNIALNSLATSIFWKTDKKHTHLLVKMHMKIHQTYF